MVGFADQRRQPLTRIGSGYLVETVVHLAGVDQLFALSAADVDAVPVVAVQRKAGNVSASRWAHVFFTQSLPRPEL